VQILGRERHLAEGCAQDSRPVRPTVPPPQTTQSQPPRSPLTTPQLS
jgi:hypothetical protein